MVTIAHVARRAGVSVSTVSFVLTGARPISKATKKRVLDAIAELGYRPNQLARSLVSRRTHTLAVVTSRLEQFGPIRAIVGIEQQAGEFGYSLLLALLHKPDETNVSPILDSLASRRVDGIIWAATEIGDNRSWISSADFNNLPPMVFLGGAPHGVASVRVDNHFGAALATQHLIDQGRRTIGYIAAPLVTRFARERFQGWEETLARAGLEHSPSLVVQGDLTPAGGARAACHLLTQRPDVDAIFACNDYMALGVLNTAQELGRRVPQDLALVGYDNTTEAEFFQPPLTSIYAHVPEMGRLAVQELHQRIEPSPESPLEPIERIIIPELIVRASSAPTRSPDTHVPKGGAATL